MSQYTYIVGRVFPLACGVAFLASRELLARWRGLLLAACSAAVVALPQWLLFVQAPYTFVARSQGANQPFVLNLPDAGTVLGAKLINQFLMLGWQWSTGYHPCSNRPLLAPPLFVGLLVAVGVTLYARRAGQAFSLTLVFLLLVPDLLFYEGLSPSANRTIAAIPFIFGGRSGMCRCLEMARDAPSSSGLVWFAGAGRCAPGGNRESVALCRSRAPAGERNSWARMESQPG